MIQMMNRQPHRIHVLNIIFRKELMHYLQCMP